MENETTMQLANFAHNVAWLRKHYGLSKRRMSELLKISTKTLTMIEAGKIPTNLSAEILVCIHCHFRVTPHQQLTQQLHD